MRLVDLPIRPCAAPNDAIVRTRSGLHCRDCDREILELARMTAQSFERARVRAREEGQRVCVRAVASASGDVIFAPDFVALDRVKRHTRSIALGAALAATGCQSDPPTRRAEAIVTVSPAKRYGDAGLAGALGVVATQDARRLAPIPADQPPSRADSACRMQRLFGERCGEDDMPEVVMGTLY